MDPADTAAERRPDRPTEDWPTLFAELLADVTKVLRGEAKLVRAEVQPAVEMALFRVLERAVALVIGLFGLACLLGAGILILHHWFEWWQSLVAMGTALIAVAIAASAWLRSRESGNAAGSNDLRRAR